MHAPDPLDALREALSLTPGNVPLRRYLAAQLQAAGNLDEAAAEFRQALQYSPDDTASETGLASIFLLQGRLREGLVLAERAAPKDPSGAAGLLLARLQARSGSRDAARAAYRAALATNPLLSDAALEQEIGIAPAPEEPPAPRTAQAADHEGHAYPRGEYDEDIYVGDDTDAIFNVEKPEIRFAQVGGMEAVKREIQMKIIFPLTNRDLYVAYGKRIGGGILLYGPPGCGKTHLARATAGELGAGFVTVGLHEILDMWIGSSEKRLHSLFEHARANRPCVLFFDEVDALGASRSDMRQSGGRHLINQFLYELDGVDVDNEGVLILAATNAPWHIDSAFRRPGRFDRVLFVPPPDQTARAAILQMELAGKPQEKIDFAGIAKRTEGFSGADIKGLVDVAVEAKLEASFRAGKALAIATKDLLEALKRQRATTNEWFGTARNYALYANEGGLYDDVLEFMKLR